MSCIEGRFEESIVLGLSVRNKSTVTATIATKGLRLERRQKIITIIKLEMMHVRSSCLIGRRTS